MKPVDKYVIQNPLKKLEDITRKPFQRSIKQFIHLNKANLIVKIDNILYLMKEKVPQFCCTKQNKSTLRGHDLPWLGRNAAQQTKGQTGPCDQRTGLKKGNHILVCLKRRDPVRRRQMEGFKNGRKNVAPFQQQEGKVIRQSSSPHQGQISVGQLVEGLRGRHHSRSFHLRSVRSR